MPAALQTPLAVAQHLLEAPVKAAEGPACGAVEELEKEGGGAAGEAKEDSAGEKVSAMIVIIPHFWVCAHHALWLRFCARVDGSVGRERMSAPNEGSQLTRMR